MIFISDWLSLNPPHVAEPLCFIRKEKVRLNDIINIINEIAKYGLKPNSDVVEKEIDLEENLIKIYSKYFSITYKFDNNDYSDFSKSIVPNIIENVKSNFPDFGFYHKVLDCHLLNREPDNAVGDAIDDLSDIIFDLLEIKWRAENNSEQDALWFYEFIFRSHTQQHIINLLNFMKSKNG